MKLSIREDSSNYACTVVKLPPKQKVEGLDRLVKVTVFGNDVLTQKDADENKIYIFFPCETQISAEYLSANNEFRHTNLNRDQGAKPGFFEDSGRCKAIKFKGVISTGYIAPLETLYIMGIKGVDLTKLKIGDEFTDIDGVNICKKYKVVHQQGTGDKKEGKYKRLERNSKVIPNQFRFHIDTSPLAKNLHQFEPEDIIVITDKWHGTSAVFSNVLIKKELTLMEKVLLYLGFDILTTRYDRLYSSRSVIKNEFFNKNETPGYYGEDIWAVVNKELENKIEIGITLYGEIVGYLPSGRHIQKGYNYGCISHGIGNDGFHQHKFLVYRITYTKPDGSVIEFSWQQIKDYCKKYSIETVKELWFGRLSDFLPSLDRSTEQTWEEEFWKWLNQRYLEKKCAYCKNDVWAEGIVVRRDGLETYSAYKLKSRNFLLGESKALDSGEVNIEDEQLN